MLFKKRIDLGITDADRAILQEPNGWPFTPDIYRLEKYQLQLLFVYDEWLSDRRENFILEDSGEKIGVGFSKDRFDFLIKSTDNSSVAFPEPSGHRIKGEVHAILPETFIKLDKLKLNGLKSIRDRVTILYPYRDARWLKNSPDGYFTQDGHILPEALQGLKYEEGPEKIFHLECHMYMGHPEFWMDMIYSNPFMFDRVPRFEPKKDKQWLDAYFKYQNPVE